MMKRTLKEYEKGDGYEDDQGCFHEFAEDLLQAGILEFCSCGCPEESLLYVMRGLELINERGPEDRTEWVDWFKGHQLRTHEHFKTRGAEYFFYYWCDKEELTEHGGSVPGWLTEKGAALLSLLQDFDNAEDAEEGA